MFHKRDMHELLFLWKMDPESNEIFEYCNIYEEDEFNLTMVRLIFFFRKVDKVGKLNDMNFVGKDSCKMHSKIHGIIFRTDAHLYWI